MVVAGDGVAGALIAYELRARGFEVWLLGARPAARDRGAPPQGSIECLSFEAAAALDTMGLGAVLSRAQAVATDGFENGWDGAPAHIVDGRWITVDRRALADELRAEAIRNGAEHIRVDRLPSLSAAPAAFSWTEAGLPPASRFAVDASGRAAAWSRPVVRDETRIATLFRGPGVYAARRGRVARLARGWAYALFHPMATTVGIVRPRAGAVPDRTVPDEVVRALDVPEPRSFVLDRRCAAHAQWAARPIRATNERAFLAIGDAALAHEPLAGQGIRFGIASAGAAAATITAMRLRRLADPEHRAAVTYYDQLVGGVRRRHLAALASELERAPRSIVPFTSSCRVRFEATVVTTGVRRGPTIVSEPAIRLADGGLVRWLGRFDLLELRSAVGPESSIAELAVRLKTRGMTSTAADRLIRWSVEHGVLTRRSGPAVNGETKSNGPGCRSSAGVIGS